MNKVTRSFNRKSGRTEVRGDVPARLQSLLNNLPLGQLRRGIYGGTAYAVQRSGQTSAVDPDLDKVRGMLAEAKEGDDAHAQFLSTSVNRRNGGKK